MSLHDVKRMPLTAPVTWLVIVFLYLPVVAIVWMSFNAGRSALVWSGWGIDGYLDALRDQTLVSAALKMRNKVWVKLKG